GAGLDWVAGLTTTACLAASATLAGTACGAALLAGFTASAARLTLELAAAPPSTAAAWVPVAAGPSAEAHEEEVPPTVAPMIPAAAMPARTAVREGLRRRARRAAC